MTDNPNQQPAVTSVRPTRNPIQPIVADSRGVIRFKENAIVSFLLDWAQPRGMGLNELAALNFTDDDRQQFAQLIGYSLHGYGELRSYVDDDAYGAAVAMADEGLTEDKARIAHLEHELFTVRASLRQPIARLFGVHPDDLGALEVARG